MKLLIIAIAAISLSSFTNLKAQTKRDLFALEYSFDSCQRSVLDQEIKLGFCIYDGYCDSDYVAGLDTLEAAAFGHLLELSSPEKRRRLGAEEKLWYNKRDAFFSKTDDIPQPPDFGDEGDPSAKPRYLKNHILYLIKRIRTLEKNKALKNGIKHFSNLDIGSTQQ
jgi:hypothetical protein